MKSITKVLFAALLTTSVISNAQQAITVTVSGAGDPIILLAGFATDGDEVWQLTVDQLSKNHKCHVLNYAGFAGMEPIEFPWIPKVINGIEKYIEENQIQNPIIIGHSLGGTLGIKLAANPKLQVKKLIIVDALPAKGALMMPDFNPENFQYDSPYNQQMLEMDEAAFIQMATGMAAGMTSSKDGQDRIVNWMKTTDRKTYVYGYTDYLKFDVREDLKQIKIPVKILGAGKPYGESTARENYKTQYKNLKNYELLIHKESAHFIMMDQPGWFIKEVSNFLNY